MSDLQTAIREKILERMNEAEEGVDVGDDGAFVEYNTLSWALSVVDEAFMKMDKSDTHVAGTPAREPAVSDSLDPESFGGVEVVRCDDCDRINDDYAKTCAGCGARITS